MKRLSFLILIFTGIVAISVAQTADPVRQEGMASWYGQEFAGRPTASGEIFNPAMYTAAHPNLPFGTVISVTNLYNMRKVTVRVNDRGPFVAARVIDLSMAAAEALDMTSAGVVPVLIERAIDTNLGPVAASAVPAPVVTPAVPAPIAVPAPAPAAVVPAPPPVIVITTPAPVIPVPHPAPQIIAPQIPVPQIAVPQQMAALFPAPAAKILGGNPPLNSTKSYRLQVGAYKNPKYALDAFAKLKEAGLNPNYEPHGDYYRVVLAKLRASEIQSIAQILGNAGFREALIREETGN